MNQSLHPDVRKFKAFVKNNPYVLRDVKKGDKTLQDLFEEFMLFGEEDDIWETYKNEDGEVNGEEEVGEDEKKKTGKESIRVKDILNAFKKMNMNDLQDNLAQLSGVIASVQELLMQFKQGETNNTPTQPQNREQPFPFTYRDD